MKKNYEIALKQHIKENCQDNHKSVEFYSYADNYLDNVKLAKEFSKHLGEEKVKWYKFQETKTLDKGLSEVAIICYYRDDTSGYNQVWQEIYVKGKKVGRYNY